jgi:hypothetical protein
MRGFQSSLGPRGPGVWTPTERTRRSIAHGPGVLRPRQSRMNLASILARPSSRNEFNPRSALTGRASTWPSYLARTVGSRASRFISRTAAAEFRRPSSGRPKFGVLGSRSPRIVSILGPSRAGRRLILLPENRKIIMALTTLFHLARPSRAGRRDRGRGIAQYREPRSALSGYAHRIEFSKEIHVASRFAETRRCWFYCLVLEKRSARHSTSGASKSTALNLPYSRT